MMKDRMDNSSLIIGIPSESVWSISTTFEHEKAQVTIALTVQKQSEDPSIVGRNILHELQSWLETRPSVREALDFLPHFKLPDGAQIVIWFQKDSQSLFAVSGGVVGVKREGKYYEIIPLREDFQCVQGSLFAGDVLVFGTKRFGADILPSLVASSDPQISAQKYAHGEQGSIDPTICGQVKSIMPAPENQRTPPQVESPVIPKEKRVVLPKNDGMKPSALWLRLSPRHKKSMGLLLSIGVIIVAIVLLQRFVLLSRTRRIQNVTEPLTSRLTTISSSNQSRMEKEKALAQLIADTEQALASNPSDIAIERELGSFQLQLKGEFERIAKQKHIENLPVFYDFRLIATDFVASQIQYDIPGRLAVFLDTARGKIVSLSLEKKQPQALSINTDIGKLQSLTVVDRNAYLLGNTGIYEVSLPLDTQGKTVASSSADWVSPERIGSFAKNVYIFDPGGRQIYRYDREDFSASPSAWLRGKEGVDFESVTSLSIDGDIWMGTNTGGMYRFTRGDRRNFAFTDIVNAPDTSISIYTAEMLPHIYVLEPRAKRIVIFDKSGAYVSSLVSADLESATSLIVDEEGTKAYVLAGSLVYEVEL